MLTAIPTIEKGIPFPSRQKFSRLREVLKAMEVGDSFLLDSTNPKGDMATIRKVAKEAEVKITARSVDGGSFRVWRTE